MSGNHMIPKNKYVYGGTHGVVVTVIGNGHYEPSLNPGWRDT